MKKKSIVQILKILFFLGIGFFSIWGFLRILTPEEKKEILQSFKHVKYGWLVASMAVGFVAHYLRALRWNMLIEPLGVTPKIKDTFAAVAVGYIGNFIIPRFGELARCYVLKKTSGPAVSSLFGTVIVERVVDMLVFLFMFIMALYIFLKQMKNMASGFLADFMNSFTEQKIIMLIVIMIAGITLLVLMYVFREKIRNKPLLGKLYTLFVKLKEGLLALFRIKRWPIFVLYTFVIWGCYLIMTWLCFLALEETSHLPLMAAFASVTFGTVGIILVQGGIGVYPAIVSQTLVIFGVTTSMGYAMGWITWLAQTVILIIMGMWAIAYLMFIKGLKFNDIRKHSAENSEI